MLVSFFEHADTGAEWDLSWFTPTKEVALCGHATLATSHVLAGDGKVSGKASFETLSGVLVAEIADDGIAPGQPADPRAGATRTPSRSAGRADRCLRHGGAPRSARRRP
ncbi:PhzF family phenazine biosynthesis protein [Kribbella sp. NPDC048928]|uniref:PhzF family phenazine biosynthesis protein n=1 Tax=Kribbella sp. NPDC048928 TaxID=3364111 RepID=UPI0037125A14